MAKTSDSLFRLTKAIIQGCHSRQELKEAVKLLEVDSHRQNIIEAINGLIYSRRSHAPLVAFGEKRSRSRRVLSVVDSRLERLVALLKHRNITAPKLKQLVQDQFREDVPVYKEGLDRYVRRLSKKPFFGELSSYLLNTVLTPHAKPKEDAWLRQMLSEQKKRPYEKPK